MKLRLGTDPIWFVLMIVGGIILVSGIFIFPLIVLIGAVIFFIAFIQARRHSRVRYRPA